MSKLLILKGLPGSGKTTYAMELVAKGWKRVNKDDIRAMLDNKKHTKSNEDNIKKIEQLTAFSMLSRGMNVVVDDTNFGYDGFWKQFAKDFKIEELEFKMFDVPFTECVARDAKRGDKSVGAKVIQRMYDQYLKPKAPEYSDDKQNCFIFDIDGTLALMNGRSCYDYTQVHTDISNHNIAMIERILKATGLPIIIVSGREDACLKETIKWLYDNSIPFDDIFMRKSGDFRKDSEIKKEIYKNHLKDKYNVIAVFDDRNQTIDMWRSLGLTACQVAYGNF